MVWAIEKLANRQENLNKIMKGEPRVLVYDGDLTFDNKNEKDPVELEQLRTLMRTTGCYSLRNVKHMILETGGQCNIIQYDKDDDDLSIMVVDEGIPEEVVLESHDLTLDGLKKELIELGYSSFEEIFYAEWSPGKGLYVITYEEIENKNLLIDG